MFLFALCVSFFAYFVFGCAFYMFDCFFGCFLNLFYYSFLLKSNNRQKKLKSSEKYST